MNPAGNRRRGTSDPSCAKEILVVFRLDVFWLTAFGFPFFLCAAFSLFRNGFPRIVSVHSGATASDFHGLPLPA